MIISDFMKSLGQLGDAMFRGVLLRSLGLTVLLLIGMIYGAGWVLGWIFPDSLVLPWIGEVTFLDELGSSLGVGMGLVLSVFLMTPVAALFIGLFLEEIAAAVEARHYPHLPSVSKLPVLDVVLDALRFFGVLVVANLFALILYVVLPLFAPLIFWGLNGWLLGREYFQLVALRRLGLKEANGLRRKRFFAIWIGGVLMAIPLTVPVLNLMVPILGVATFTHQFHRFSATA